MLIVWPREPGAAREADGDRFVIECKVVHGSLGRTIEEGVQQTAGYMSRCGAPMGHLVVFDRRAERSWDEKIFRRDEFAEIRTITVWGM